MKFAKTSSLIVFIAILALSFYIGELKINSKIEESIKTNYESEIAVLKEKLNKQSELINSIISLQNKEDAPDSDNTQVGNSQEAEDQSQFKYVIENGGITITRYIGKSTSVQIPNKIDGISVLKIGENAFADSKIKSVALPSSCIEIGWFAFYGCYALTTVYVSDSIDTIGYGAFDSCSKSLTIYCVNGSFAEKYAQSFGINYEYFK